MASLGEYLRELRTRRNMSREDLARTTRVAPRYLAALESDDLAGLPAPAFTRGFIRAYCQVLGERPDEALALYQESDRTRPPASPERTASLVSAGPSEPETARSRSAVLVSFVLLVVLGMALFAVTLMIHPQRDTPDRRVADIAADTPPPPRPVPTVPSPTAPMRPSAPTSAPSTAGPSASPPGAAPRPTTAPPGLPAGIKPPPSVPAPAATAPAVKPPSTLTPAPSTAGPSAPGAPGAAPGAASAAAAPRTPTDLSEMVGLTSPYRLVARASEPTWIRVRMADGRVSEETVFAGDVREWVSNEPFVLTIGNAGGISLELNGRQLPSLGASGAVIARLVLPPGR